MCIMITFQWPDQNGRNKKEKKWRSGRTSPWLSGGGQALTGRHIILLLDINHLRESQSQARHSRTIIKTSMSS